ncbi:unnamed protein product [Bursaphelenchus okinawaensis]|uniref:Serpentine receptor class gamma n=1 Tax=Bursaphelenchus okinawaensis TaxID=465554 RepID=A0A811JS34_9BILA|nr:unnamed protein product [Bursaphelenchus okinawaensis]CAG9080337.1 unnamed protein product [Bursaphelenchus okinawaensis]
MFCVVKYSTDIMATYKWYIIWSITSVQLYIMIMASYEVEVFEFYRFTISRGVIDYFQIPELAIVLQALAFAFFEMYTVTTLCRFVYRYAQSTNRQKILYLMSHKLFFLGLLMLLLFILFMTIIDGRHGLEDGREFQLQFPNDNAELKEYIMSHSVTYIRAGYTTRAFKLLFYPLTVVISSICAYKCYRFQMDPSNRLTANTRQLYHLLILNLLIETLAEFVWFIVPYVAIPIYLPIEKHVIGYYVVYRLFYAYPTFVMVFVLLFYKRYNIGVRKLFGVLKNSVKRQQVSVTDAFTGTTVPREFYLS